MKEFYCEHCGSGPQCSVCGRGHKKPQYGISHRLGCTILIRRFGSQTILFIAKGTYSTKAEMQTILDNRQEDVRVRNVSDYHSLTR